MRKILFVCVLSVLSVVLYGKDYNFLPKKEKVLKYSVEVKSPMQQEPIINKCSQYINEADGKVEYIIEVKDKDEKSVVAKQQVSYTKEGDFYRAKLDEALAGQLEQLGGSFEIVKQEGELLNPAKFTKETVLKPVSAVVKVNVQGMDLELTISYENRKVEGEEVVETKAGKFDCIKVTEELIIEVMGQEQTTKITSWYGENGLVKQVLDGMNGMVNSTQELEQVVDKN